MTKAKHQISKKPRTRKPKPKSGDLINQLGEALKSYQQVFDTLTHAKPFATHDYDALLKQLQEATAEVGSIQKRLKKEKIELDGGDQFFEALVDEMEVYQRIVTGLGHKANRTGRYGWLKYRRDIRAHNAARQNRSIRAEAFVRTEPAPEPELVDVVAHVFVLDPFSENGLVEEDVKVLKSQYEEMKDGKGNLYGMVSYENGIRKPMLLMPKETWESFASSMVTTPEEREAATEKMMADIMKDKKD